MSLLPEWNRNVKLVLKKSVSSKNLNVFCENLLSVHIGLKPSYLWDIPVKINRCKIIQAVDTLKEKGLLSPNVKILILAEDLFIVNAEEIKKLHLFPKDNFKFVNCSFELESSELILDCEVILKTVCALMDQIMSNSTQDIIDVCTNDDWCMPSMFGILLGYPVVYWSSSNDNNLSLQSLDLFKLGYSSDSFSVKELYSFTAPSGLALKPFVESWKSKLAQRFPGTLILTVSTVSYPLGHLREASHYFRQSLEINGDHLPAFGHLQSVSNRLVERWHFRMLNDEHRNEAYREAVLKKVRQGFDRVLDIGTGTGILSLYAVASGAKEVYACDYSPTMCTIASDVLAANKMADSVKVINKLSNNLNIPQDLPRRASLVVTETIDCGLLGEHLLSTLLHAWRRLLLPPSAQLRPALQDDTPLPPRCGVVLPLGARLWAVPVRCPTVARRNYVTRCSRWNLQSVRLFAAASGEPYDTENLRTQECEFLSDPIEIFSFDFNDPTQLEDFYEGKNGKSVTFRYKGTADAVAVWFDVILDEDITISSSPLVENSQCAWDQAVFRFEKPVDSTVELDVNCAGGKLEFKVIPDSGLDSRSSLSESRTMREIAVSGDVVCFMNNVELQNSLYTLPEHCKNVKSVLDLSPFPLLGLRFVQLNGAELVCVLRTEADVDALKVFVEDNHIDWNKVKCLKDSDLNGFFAGADKFDFVSCSFFESSGEFRTDKIEDIPLMMNLLSPGGVLSPTDVTVTCQLVDCDWAIRTSRVTNEELTQNYRIAELINIYKVSQQLDVNLRNIEQTGLSEQTPCLCLAVGELAADSCRNASVPIPVVRDGRVTCIAVWYHYQLNSDSQKLSTNSENSHVNQTLFVVDSPVDVKSGDTIVVNVSYYLGILRLKIQT